MGTMMGLATVSGLSDLRISRNTSCAQEAVRNDIAHPVLSSEELGCPGVLRRMYTAFSSHNVAVGLQQPQARSRTIRAVRDACRHRRPPAEASRHLALCVGISALCRMLVHPPNDIQEGIER